MGDHRLSVKISVIGSDHEEYNIDMWVNWNENHPSIIHDSMVKMAERAGLPVNPFYEEQI